MNLIEGHQNDDFIIRLGDILGFQFLISNQTVRCGVHGNKDLSSFNGRIEGYGR